MAARGRALLLRGRVSLLWPLHHHEDLLGRRSARDASRANGGRSRLSADESMGRLRSSLRSDCRTWPACRTDARRAVRISPRRDLDRRRRRARRRRAGSRHSPRLRPSQRTVAGHDGARRNRAGGGHHGTRGDSWNHGRSHRRAGARGRQCARGESMGRGDDRAHDTDRVADGGPSPVDSTRASARGERDGPRTAGRGALRRSLGCVTSRRRART